MTSAELHYEKMTKTPVAKLILRLGLPTTISMLVTSIYNMADTYFVGTLGPTEQAATGILFALQSIIQGLAFMLGHGSGTFVAKSLADKDTDKASTYVSTAFFTGGAVGLVTGVSLPADPHPLRSRHRVSRKMRVRFIMPAPFLWFGIRIA